MKCTDNDQCSNSEVQRKNAKQKQSKHGPPQELVVHVRSGVSRSEHPLLTDHTCVDLNIFT